MSLLFEVVEAVCELIEEWGMEVGWNSLFKIYVIGLSADSTHIRKLQVQTTWALNVACFSPQIRSKSQLYSPLTCTPYEVELRFWSVKTISARKFCYTTWVLLNFWFSHSLLNHRVLVVIDMELLHHLRERRPHSVECSLLWVEWEY